MQWTEDMSSEVKYRIYPSLLDKFQSFLDADIEAEGFWNVDSETGEQKRTAEEIADTREQELLDAINRVPHEPIEAADKGTCFNELVDWLNGNESRVAIRRNDDGTECPPYVCELNGFVFKFSAELTHEVAEMFRGAVPQYLCKGYLDTCYGAVELYGYADEILRNKVFDLKTTSAYSFGKFERGWQKEVYPWCLTSWDDIEVKEFEYTVVQLTKPSQRNPVIGGKIYREVYTYDHEATEKRLKAFVERFIEWLESHRGEITDAKIFGGEKL